MNDKPIQIDKELYQWAREQYREWNLAEKLSPFLKAGVIGML
jgi:hypothetical protein